MERKNIIILIAIVILGLVLRFTSLVSTPPSLNWDEVSHGYNAYSILKTGMDQWGEKFPLLNFKAYGDFPTTLNLYLTIPFIAIFGLTEFAIRFPHALLGTLTIISVFFLTLGITKKQNVALLTSFLVSIGPWYVFTSRFVLQSNLSVFLLITALAFFVYRSKKKLFLPVSLILLTLTLFSYHTTRILSPLLLLGAVIIYRKEISKKIIYVFTAIFLALSIFILVNPGATARGNVLFLIDQSAVNKIEQQRVNSKQSKLVARLLYNRPTYFVKSFAKNYFEYFSPNFLFFKGGTQYQFSVPGFGLIYPICLPFFYIGLVLLIIGAIKNTSVDSRNDYRLLFLWLVLSPIAASLTNESFAVLRATTMLPIPEILIALAFFYLLEKIPEKVRLLVLGVFTIALLLSAENYFSNYFEKYSKEYSWSWQYGYKEVVGYVQDNYDNYDKIIVSKKYGEPHEFFLFFMKYDPMKYQEDSNKIAFFQTNWYWVDRFDKFFFVNDWQVPKSGYSFVLESKNTVSCAPTTSRCLLITSPNNYPAGWDKLKTIKFLNGEPAFEIYKN